MRIFLKPCIIQACLLLAVIAPAIIALDGGASAQTQTAQTPPSAASAGAIIDMQLHAAGTNTPNSQMGGGEADMIYRHYLADIGRPVTHNNNAGSQTQSTLPPASGGH